MKERKPLESGQAIVLLVISLVVLLGFTALAIDGGMVYSDRRHAQNAADTASLAGAGQVAARLESAKLSSANWNCTDVYTAIDNYAIGAAIYRAKTNGYDVEEGIIDGNGVEITCDQSGKFVDVRTAILAETRTSFAHLFISSPLRNQVEAIARVKASEAFGGGNALLALNTDACLGTQNGLVFSGRAEITLTGGDAYTNCCLLGNGNRFVVTTTDGGAVYYYDDEGTVCDPSGTMTNVASPVGPQSGDEVFTKIDPWEPECGGPGTITTAGRTTTYTQGTYTRITQSSNLDSLIMEPGLYCLTGSPDAFKISGGNLRAEGVTLYVTQGNVSITGGGEVYMAAPCTSGDSDNGRCNDDDEDGDTYPDPALAFFLIYMAEGNTSTVNIEGNATSYFEGTIYSPDGKVFLAGTSDTTTFKTQVVAKDIEVTGSGEVNINFDDSQVMYLGSRLDNLQ
jgi:hypothetical protein